MGQGHVKVFQSIKGCRVTAVCDINYEQARAVAKERNIPSAYGDVAEMLDREKLDAVSVVTNDCAHRDPCLLAAERGLHVMCEKPLATNLKDAQRMAEVARRKKIITAVNFSKRNAPGVQRAAELVRTGKLGRVIHVEGSYLQSWLVSDAWGEWRKTPRLLWRLSTRHGSGGVLGDLGVHIYDMASFIAGDFAALCCEMKTFDKGVKKIGEYVFDANDSVVAAVRYRNGALGTLHTTRWATGYANTEALRVFGDKGALDLNLSRPAEQQLLGCFGRKDIDSGSWKPVKCPAVPTTYQRFITAVRTGKQGQAGFDVGVKVQAYLEYSRISAAKGDFVSIPKISR